MKGVNMIAVCVNQSVELFFDGIPYNRDDTSHQQLMDECALLQWPAKQALQHIQENGYYYCAVYRTRIVEVYEMDRDKPFITMTEAIDQGLIKRKGNNWEIKGFAREIGMLDNGNEKLYPERLYFLNSRRAPENVARQWIIENGYYRFYGNIVGYIPTPDYVPDT